jgi:hypothetical protein
MGEEIIEKTKHLYCFGEWDDGLLRRIEFAKTMEKGEKAIEFGIGNGRTAFVTLLANPDIWVYGFDYGRTDIKDEDLLIRVVETAHSLGIYRYIPMISEATKAIPRWNSPIGYLGIDTDGEGTGEQLDRWAQFVRTGGKIFIQNYGLSKYPKVKQEVDAFINKNTRYVLGKQTPETVNEGPQLREIDVI